MYTKLPFYALAFLAGVCFIFLFSTLTQLAVISCVLLILVIIDYLRKRVYKQRIFRVFQFFAFGFVWAALFMGYQTSLSLDQRLTGKEVIIEGVIQGLVERQGRVVRFNFKVLSSRGNDTGLSRGSIIRVSDYRKQHARPEPGEAWRLLLRIKSPHGFANPAGFEYEKWLFSKRIVATAYIRKNKDKIKTLNVRVPGLDQNLTIDRHRQKIATVIAGSLPESEFVGIITALAIGDRRAISLSQWSILQLTGTSHLMAISGLHVGLVAGMTFLLFQFLFAKIPLLPLKYPAYKLATLAALFCATVYSLLAGFGLPTQRALLMLALFSAAILLQRRLRLLDILSITLLLVVLFDPLSVLLAGFWLSFSAVAMIAYIVLEHQHGGWKKHAGVQAINIQVKLSLMMAPATLLFFQQIPVSGVIANLIAIPVVTFLVVPLVLTASMAASFLDAGLVTHFIYVLAASVIAYLWMILEWISGIVDMLDLRPGDSPGNITIRTIGLGFAVLVLMLPRAIGLRGLALAGFLVFLAPRAGNDVELDNGEFRVILLDVGQGLSTLVMTGQHSLLFDTGAKFSKTFNAGDAVVIPVLKSVGVATLNRMIISHDDNDHRGSAETILMSVKVEQVISNEPIPGIDSTACVAGMHWQWDGVDFTLLHPQKSENESSPLKGNNSSCVLKVESIAGSILMTGDIEKEVEQLLVDANIDTDKLGADVLVAGHHGSNTSSSENFIQSVSPGLVIFAAGWKNRYHHPAEKVTQRFISHNIPGLTTGECGAISVEFSLAGVTASSWRHENPRLWYSKESDKRCRKVAVKLL